MRLCLVRGCRTAIATVGTLGLVLMGTACIGARPSSLFGADGGSWPAEASSPEGSPAIDETDASPQTNDSSLSPDAFMASAYGADESDVAVMVDSSVPSDDSQPEDEAAGRVFDADGGVLADASNAHDSPAETSPPSDARACSEGPQPTFELSCDNCTVSPTCLLTCWFCYTVKGTKAPFPTLQLPCPSGLSVTNNNGLLQCF